LYKRGTKISFKTQASINLSSVSSPPLFETELRYTEPWVKNFKAPTFFRLFYKFLIYETEPIVQSVKFFGSEINSYYRFTEHSRLGLALEYRVVKATISDSLKIINPRDNQRRFGLYYRFDNRNNVLFPKRGTTILIEPQLFGTILGGTSHFYKSEFTITNYTPVFGNTILALRAKFGFMENISEKDTIPIYERFRLGGDNSIRGFENGKIEPVVNGASTGKPFGNIKLLLNAELRIPLFWRFGLNIFVDAGNLWADRQNFIDNRQIFWSTGFGITLATPLGPGRMDFGVPMNWKVKKRRIHLELLYAF
jgi:outer membrane protein insertion porin family